MTTGKFFYISFSPQYLSSNQARLVKIKTQAHTFVQKMLKLDYLMPKCYHFLSKSCKWLQTFFSGFEGRLGYRNQSPCLLQLINDLGSQWFQELTINLDMYLAITRIVARARTGIHKTMEFQNNMQPWNWSVVNLLLLFLFLLLHQ